MASITLNLQNAVADMVGQSDIKNPNMMNFDASMGHRLFLTFNDVFDKVANVGYLYLQFTTGTITSDLYWGALYGLDSRVDINSSTFPTYEKVNSNFAGVQLLREDNDYISYKLNELGMNDKVLQNGLVWLYDTYDNAPNSQTARGKGSVNVRQAGKEIKLRFTCDIAYKPTPTNLTHSSNSIEQDVVVSWDRNLLQKSFNAKVLDGSTVIHTATGTTQNTFTIPKSKLPYNKNVTVQVQLIDNFYGNDVVGDYESVSFTTTANTPTISNLSTVGELWEQPITVSWRSTLQSGFEYECYYNNVKVKSGTGSGTSLTIPSNTFKGTLNSSVKVRVFRTINGTKIYTDWLEKSLTLKNITPSIQTLNVNANNIDYQIPIAWTSTNQSKWKLEVLQGGVVKTTFTGTTQKAYTIAAKAIKFFGNAKFKLSVAYTGLDGVDRWVTKETTVTLDKIEPSINSLLISGDLWERSIGVSWQSANQSKYEITVLKNNEVVRTYTGTTSKSYTIAANQLTKGDHVFRVRVAYTGAAGDVWSGYVTKTVDLQDITATISNVIVNGEFWESATEVSWQSENQQQYKIEAWKNNVKVKTWTGTTAKRFTIAANELTQGEHVIKVWVAYAGRYVNNEAKSVTFQNITPTVDNLNLSGSNIDYDLTLSWDSTYQSKAMIEVYKGDTKVDTINVTTAKSYVFDNNTLQVGGYTFKVKVAYTSVNGDRWTEFIQFNTTLVESLPSIGALQPDGIILDKNTPIRAWWTSQNQSKYTLEVIGSGYSYTGTTEKDHYIPMGTLQVGTHTLKLTVTFVTGAGVEKSVSKQSKFIVTGKPNTPTITSNPTFSYNRPVFTWDSAEQLGFICIVEDLEGNVVWTSDWQNGLITRIKCMNYLQNGTYKVKVQIMNEFSLKSDFAVRQFTVNASESTLIDLSVDDVQHGKKLYWTNENAYYQAFYIIRDGEVIAKTDKLEYYDFECGHGENSYIVRGVTGNDTYKDSNEVITSLKLSYGTLATISATGDCINSEIQRDSYATDMSHTINSTTIYLNGREHPIVITGEHITEQYSINFVSKDYKKFIQMCDRRETFVHRDRLGNVTYLSITNPSLKVDRLGGVFSATGLKVDYREVISYD